MIAAVSTSALFLVSYLVYHAQVGSVRFTKTGVIRMVYFTVLLTHTVLAAAIVPMVLVTLSRGLSGQIRPPPPHRAMDDADLALRFGYRRHRLRDALSALTVDRPGTPGGR